MHSIEHVPDAAPVLEEIARVLEPGGTAVLVTPNRLTFGRPDEIIDPYHFVEYDADELRDLCSPHFDQVEVHGVFGSDRYMELFDEERERLARLLRIDPLRVRRMVPRRARQRLYDRMLTRARREEDPRAAAITPEDFSLRDHGLEACLDVMLVGRGPISR